jgi:hypothetical protein
MGLKRGEEGGMTFSVFPPFFPSLDEVRESSRSQLLLPVLPFWKERSGGREVLDFNPDSPFPRNSFQCKICIIFVSSSDMILSVLYLDYNNGSSPTFHYLFPKTESGHSKLLGDSNNLAWYSSRVVPRSIFEVLAWYV